MRSTLALCILIAVAAACGKTSVPAPSSAYSALAVDRDVVLANGVSTVRATATVRDEGNVPMAGVTVAFLATGSGNVWTPPTAVTDGNGVATATLASTNPGARTLGITAGGVAVAQTQSVTFLAPLPSASRSSLAVSVPVVLANGASTTTATATVRDEDGVPMAGVPVAFDATGSGNLWGPSTGTTNANGVAQATLASTTAEEKVVRVTAAGVGVAQTQSVTFTVPEPSPSRSSFTVSVATVIANGVSTTEATATVRDEDGVAIAGAPVTFSASGGGNAWNPESAVTDGNGIASATLASTIAGARILGAVARGVSLSQTQPVAFTAPSPSSSRSSLVVNPSAAGADGLATIAATATVRDADGVALAGVEVAFASTGSANVWTPATAVSTASGVATAVIASTVAEPKTLRVNAGGVSVAQDQRVTFTPAPVPPPDLLISEVGNGYDPAVPSWIEIHNRTDVPVNLAAYTLRARGLDADSGATVPSTTFALPSLSVPAGGYAVVAGKAGVVTFDGGLLVHVRDPVYRVPYWGGSGFVELLKAGATVDFVRIGPDATLPTTTGYWNGVGTGSLPVGPDRYNVALARRPAGQQTHGAADWVLVSFPTPGGPNDVAPGAVSSDGDGIPDSAKVAGGTYAGLDLYSMGARRGHRDIFIELDGMESTDAGVLPRKESLDSVVARFRQHGVYLHIDAGARFSATVSPALYNLGQPSWNVPFSPCLKFPQDAYPSSCAYVHAYKAEHMQVARRAVFHYALFGSSQREDGSGGSSGRADIIGSNFIVTMGNWGFRATPESELVQLVNMQASTFMHEFGHNLGLRHGGDENLNYKPNYLSIMNYLHQLVGLPDPAAATAGDRYTNNRYGFPTVCSLDASPCGSPASFRMDYSNGSGAPLDENAVSESLGLGRGGHWVDYDNDGEQNDGYALQLAETWEPSVLHDFDDWSNLVLPFQSYASWVLGAPARTLTQLLRRPVTPFNDRDRELSEEPDPSPAFFEQLRRSRPAR